MKLLRRIVILDLDNPETEMLEFKTASPHELPVDFETRIEAEQRARGREIVSRRSGERPDEQIWEVRKMRPNRLSTVLKSRPKLRTTTTRLPPYLPTGTERVAFTDLRGDLPDGLVIERVEESDLYENALQFLAFTRKRWVFTQFGSTIQEVAWTITDFPPGVLDL